jgi:hypothetical protein
MALQLLDLFETTLSASYTAGGSSLTLTSVSGLPSSGDYWIAVYDPANAASTYEVFKVTGAASGSVIPVTGEKAYGSVLTASALTQLKLDINGSGISIYTGVGRPDGVGPDLAPHNMTSNTAPSPYVASASSELNPAWKAFDGTTGMWTSTGSTGWLKLDLGSAKSLGKYGWKSGPSGNPQQHPRNWTFSGSNDNSTFNTVDTQTAIASVGSSVTQLFTMSPTVAYRFWKFDVTVINGGSNVEFDEFYLYQAATVFTGGVTGDLYLDTSGLGLYGPKTSGGAWPYIGKLSP